MPPSGVDYASEFLNGYAPEYVSQFSSGRRPSDYPSPPPASKMQNSKLSAALRAKNTFMQ